MSLDTQFAEFQQQQATPFPLHVPAGQLVAHFTELRRPVIDGLIRETETLNVIAAPKSHKTYMALHLALSVAVGRLWLGFKVSPGRVLYVDCELHQQTFARRLAAVASAMGLYQSEFADALEVASLRGQQQNILSLGAWFRSIERARFKVIVLDALYRLFPKDFDENSNADMTAIYNQIDQYAEQTGAAFVVVHHASKGNQSNKAVTDVGSGAGAQSRAADSHLVLRPHEEEGAIVLEGAVRSFPPIRPACLRWTYPIWSLAPDLDPAKLRQEGRRRRAEPEPAKAAEPAWTPERFAAALVGDEPIAKTMLEAKARQAGIKGVQLTDLISLAVAGGHLHRWEPKGSKDPLRYAKVPQPVCV